MPRKLPKCWDFNYFGFLGALTQIEINSTYLCSNSNDTSEYINISFKKS